MTDKENNKPSITIDGVQIYVDELSEEAQGIFGRLQRLIQKKATLTLDLEEIQAGINFFSSRIVNSVNSDFEVTKEDTTKDVEVDIKENEKK